ncbi:MAG: RepB family plasmid replication initiator protein, partial [Poseidonibacter sp.]|uniref:RepB family plasmid replication initiator protein n=1 Tax=Poseidonibacter sp. TaxID=2321188 RepID=UPI00359E511D
MKPKTKINIAKKYVVQRNELLYGTTTVFNLNDLKIFKLIISKVNSKDPRFNEYYNITNEELKELNINHKHLYKTTLTTLKKLANVYMTIDTVENGQAIVKEVGLIQNNFKFRKYSNQFSISFH